MGAWGYGIMDNDAARDIAALWKTYIGHGLRADPKFWTPARVADFLINGHFRGPNRIDYDNPETTAELLAVGALYKKAKLPLQAGILAFIERAAAAELEASRLAEWAEPDARRKAIEKLLQAIGGSIPNARPLTRTVDEMRNRFAAELAKWEEFSKHYPRWIEISHRPFGDDEFFKQVPKWFMELQDFVGRGVRHPDPRLQDAAMRYRAMCLAFYTGFVLRRPDDERLNWIRSAELPAEPPFIMPN